MVYLLSWGAIYYSICTAALVNYRGRAFGLLVILFFVTLAVLRGSTGTDTANYESMLAGLSLTNWWRGVEPGFGLLGACLVALLGSAEAGVRGVSALFFLLASVYYVRSDRNESFFFLAYLAPAYFLQYSMNALRIGLASMILAIAIQELRRKHVKRCMAMALVAVSFHYTIVFSILFLVLIMVRRLRALPVVAAAFLGILFIYLLGDYIGIKLVAYSELAPPSPLSGLSKIAVIAVLTFGGAVLSALPARLRSKSVVWSVAFCLLAAGVSQVTYAGLRLLDLLAFASPLAIVALHSRSNLALNASTRTALVLGGAISALATYRGFLLEAEAGVGATPFLPYRAAIEF